MRPRSSYRNASSRGYNASSGMASQSSTSTKSTRSRKGSSTDTSSLSSLDLISCSRASMSMNTKRRAKNAEQLLYRYSKPIRVTTVAQPSDIKSKESSVQKRRNLNNTSFTSPDVLDTLKSQALGSKRQPHQHKDDQQQYASARKTKHHTQYNPIESDYDSIEFDHDIDLKLPSDMTFASSSWDLEQPTVIKDKLDDISSKIRSSGVAQSLFKKPQQPVSPTAKPLGSDASDTSSRNQSQSKVKEQPSINIPLDHKWGANEDPSLTFKALDMDVQHAQKALKKTQQLQQTSEMAFDGLFPQDSDLELQSDDDGELRSRKKQQPQHDLRSDDDNDNIPVSGKKAKYQSDTEFLLSLADRGHLSAQDRVKALAALERSQQQYAQEYEQITGISPHIDPTVIDSIELDGIKVPLRGIKRSEAEAILQEDEEDSVDYSEDEREARDFAKRLGFTDEELDADKPNRVNYSKIPDVNQLPLIDATKLDFSNYKHNVLHWDVTFPEHTSTTTLSLRACILGTPNAGKSMLVNNLTRAKVTAVSPKRNTTRRRVLGVATDTNTQVTIYDTPGINEIHEAKNYQRDLATEAWDAVADADMALVVIDAAKRIGGPELFLLHKCSDVKSMAPHMRWVLVLNKVDIVEPKDKLLDMLFRIQTLMPFDDCFMISALDGDGMADVENYLYTHAVPRDWEHAGESKTDQSDIQLATELIRETLYMRLNKEIPYAVQQENIEWDVLANGQLRIDQRLIVRKQQHKDIIIGQKGAALRAITSAAKNRLELAFKRPVSLFLRVSVSVTQDYD